MAILIFRRLYYIAIIQIQGVYFVSYARAIDGRHITV